MDKITTKVLPDGKIDYQDVLSRIFKHAEDDLALFHDLSVLEFYQKDRKIYVKTFEEGGDSESFKVGLSGSQSLSTDGKIVDGAVRVRLPFAVHPKFISELDCVDKKQPCSFDSLSENEFPILFSVKNAAKGATQVASFKSGVVNGLKHGNVLQGTKWVTGMLEGEVVINDCH